MFWSSSVIRRAASYQRSGRRQTKSTVPWSLFLQADDTLPLFHQTDFFTRNDFKVFGIVFQKLDFPSLSVAKLFLESQNSTLPFRFAGEFVPGTDFRQECRKQHHQNSETDQSRDQFVRFVPSLGFAPSLGAEFLHNPCIIQPTPDSKQDFKTLPVLQTASTLPTKQPMGKKRTRWFLGLVVLISGCLLFVAGAAWNDLMRFAAEPVIHIPTTVEVRSKPLYRDRKFPVEIRPWLQARVSAETPGRILETLSRPGQVLKKGDAILRLDDGTARIALDLAIARHMETSRLLVETERLLEAQTVPQSAYEAALEQVRTSRLQLDAARDIFEKHTVRAPFSGILDGIFVNTGDSVQAGDPLAKIVDLEKLRVYLDVTESDLSAFQRGSRIPLRLNSFAHEGLESRVEYVSRSSDPATALFRVESILDNEKSRLPGGITGTAEVRVLAYPRGPVVPAEAVEFAIGDAVVFKDRSGKTVPSRIQVGPEIDGLFPVLSGLSEGDKIVIH